MKKKVKAVWGNLSHLGLRGFELKGRIEGSKRGFKTNLIQSLMCSLFYVLCVLCTLSFIQSDSMLSILLVNW